MIVCGDWPIGVCSWSLGNDLNRLNDLRRRTKIDRVHLCLYPVNEGSSQCSCENFIEDGWTISAAMVGFRQENYATLESIRLTGGIAPDAFWPENKAIVLKAIETAASFEIPYLEFHIGYLDYTEPIYAMKMELRIRELADVALKNNGVILLETGQESAQTLCRFIERLDHPSIGINFDPANMILYGQGSPVDAIKTLYPWVRHVHVKDATFSKVPGQWGKEVVWGAGQVDTDSFLSSLKSFGFSGTLSIERESGTGQTEEIEAAIEKLTAFSFEGK